MLIDLIGGGPKFISVNILRVEIPHTRNFYIEITKYQAEKADIFNRNVHFAILGTLMDTWAVKDSTFINCKSLSPFFATRFASLATYQNISFFNSTSNIGPFLDFKIAKDVIIKDIYIENYSSDQSGSSPRIDINSFDDSSPIIQNVTVVNSSLYGNSLIYVANSPKDLVIQGGDYHNVSLQVSIPLIYLASVNNFSLSDQRVVGSDSFNREEKSSFLEISTINVQNLNYSVVENITFVESSLSFIEVNSLSGTLEQKKVLSLKNVIYSD